MEDGAVAGPGAHRSHGLTRKSTTRTITVTGAPDAKYEDVYTNLTGPDVSNVEDI
jgi:hypothetical protein